MASTYQPGIPTGLVPLDQDYLNLQGNFLQLDTSFGVDHTKFSVDTASNPAGYHKVIHIISNSGTPATKAGFGQLYTRSLNDGVATDTELFFKTGGGLNIQLTRNFSPVAAGTGYTMLPGGLILQWGTQAFGNITFPLPFPNNCFNVQVTMKTNNTNITHSNSIVIRSISTTTVVLSQNINDTITGFYWTAIGN